MFICNFTNLNSVTDKWFYLHFITSLATFAGLLSVDFLQVQLIPIYGRNKRYSYIKFTSGEFYKLTTVNNKYTKDWLKCKFLKWYALQVADGFHEEEDPNVGVHVDLSFGSYEATWG